MNDDQIEVSNDGLTPSDILIYQTEDGSTRVEVRLIDETVWLSQKQMAELFQKDKRTISEHIRNIFDEGELGEDSVVRNFRTTASDGKTYQIRFYNLDDFLKISEREILDHAGKVSQENARLKAEGEYDKYKFLTASDPSPVERHFEKAVKELKKIESKKDKDAE